mgnify:FL=1
MIKICDRFRPFSHTPGAQCMIPKSNWGLEAYPSEIRFFSDEKSFSLVLKIRGPVAGFTLEQDLERGCVRIFGTGKEGYYHLIIEQRGGLLGVTLKRGAPLSYLCLEKEGMLQKGEFLELSVDSVEILPGEERLSLGMNKKLDWDLVSRRGDLKEILPVLYFLGQKAPRPSIEEFPQISIEELVTCYFHSILVPSRESDTRLGLSLPQISGKVPLAAILYKSYEAIRALFIEEKGDEISIFPHLPPKFVCGRMCGIKTKRAVLDLEWSKGRLHKMRVEPLSQGPLRIRWPKDIDSFRLKEGPREKGRTVSHIDTISLELGQIIYLDKFQK